MDAASFICVMDELRPLDPATYNPFYEVWTRIERIPPQARHRLLDELEPGSLRNLWKASMARYVLDEGRSLQLFSDASVWDDFPTEPGQVFVYKGRCERYELSGPEAVGFTPNSAAGPPSPVDLGTPVAPWLRVTPGSFEVPVTRFTQLFFVPPVPPGLLSEDDARESTSARARARADAEANAAATAALSGCFAHASAERGEEDPEEAEEEEVEDGEERSVYSRVVLPLAGPLDRWWEPIYCRLHVGLTLTPLAKDAGADLLLLYPSDPACTTLRLEGTDDTDDGGSDGSEGSDPSTTSGQAALSSSSRISPSLAAAAAASGAAPPDPPDEAEPWILVGREALPPGSTLWPTPDPDKYAASPFSGGGRDFLRVAGPGVYVGCAYRRAPAGSLERFREEDCVYFVIARRE